MNGTAVERVREALQEHDCRPRGTNLKLRAKCPVHGSHGPTLAVSQGRAGAVIWCHAQCEVPDVLAAIGLTWADLYDEPMAREHHPARAPRRPDPLGDSARVIVRAIGIQLAAETIQRTPLPGIGLTPDERVAHAEWAAEVEAGRHYWRVLARWAALACDRAYVAQAYADQEAWLERRGDKPSHEQFMVLLFRAEDLERAR
jgi:hypothetical protein